MRTASPQARRGLPQSIKSASPIADRISHCAPSPAQCSARRALPNQPIPIVLVMRKPRRTDAAPGGEIRGGAHNDSREQVTADLHCGYGLALRACAPPRDAAEITLRARESKMSDTGRAPAKRTSRFPPHNQECYTSHSPALPTQQASDWPPGSLSTAFTLRGRSTGPAHVLRDNENSPQEGCVGPALNSQWLS